MDGKSDEELMQEASRDNLKSFELLVGRYKDRMYGFLMRYVRNQETAQDLFQEVFLKVYQARFKYRPLAKFSTWLYTIARNQCLDYLKGFKAGQSVSLETGRAGSSGEFYFQDMLKSEDADPLAQAQNAQRVEIVKRAMKELPENYQSFLILSVYQGLRYEEIAHILGCSTDAIKMRAVRAHQALGQKLNELKEELR